MSRGRISEFHDRFDSMVASGSRIEILSDTYFFIEGSCGINSYSDICIKLNVGKGYVTVEGTELEIVYMQNKKAGISGNIKHIELCI